MKTINITKNGLTVGTFSFDENAGETLKRFAIRVSNTNVNANYEIKVTGDVTRTYTNL
jgi:hypothetical protein